MKINKIGIALTLLTSGIYINNVNNRSIKITDDKLKRNLNIYEKIKEKIKENSSEEISESLDNQIKDIINNNEIYEKTKEQFNKMDMDNDNKVSYEDYKNCLRTNNNKYKNYTDDDFSAELKDTIFFSFGFTEANFKSIDDKVTFDNFYGRQLYNQIIAFIILDTNKDTNLTEEDIEESFLKDFQILYYNSMDLNKDYKVSLEEFIIAGFNEAFDSLIY